MNTWENQGGLSLLPQIANRLAALKEVHNQGFSFQQSVQQIEQQQEELKKKLSFNADLVRQVQTNFQQNVSSIQNNFNLLEKRITIISQKIGGENNNETSSFESF
jgi:chromosome segregation ATPase